MKTRTNVPRSSAMYFFIVFMQKPHKRSVYRTDDRTLIVAIYTPIVGGRSRDKLVAIGKKNESYDDIILQLFEFYKTSYAEENVNRNTIRAIVGITQKFS